MGEDKESYWQKFMAESSFWANDINKIGLVKENRRCYDYPHNDMKNKCGYSRLLISFLKTIVGEDVHSQAKDKDHDH